MSRREIIAMTNDAEWAIYRAVESLALRDDFMRNAADYKRVGSRDAVVISVQSAREWNHKYLKRVAEYRAMKAAEVSKRKRA